MRKEAEINKQSLALQDIVDDLIVNNSLELENAVNMVKAIKKHREIIIEYWREAKESAKKTYHEISSKEKSMLNICDSAEKSIRDKITRYNLLKKACRNEMIHQANAEKYSQSYRKYKRSGNQDDALRASQFEKMAEKTVLKALISRYGIMSTDIQQAVKSDQSKININFDTGEQNIEYIDNLSNIERISVEEQTEILEKYGGEKVSKVLEKMEVESLDSVSKFEFDELKEALENEENK